MTQSATRTAGWTHTPGTPCWASLLVHGLSEGQEFYHELFGWEFATGPQQLGSYVRALLDGQEVAGLGEISPGRQLSVSWLPYLASDDADATAAMIRERGGTVAVGPLDADSAGRMAVAADATGAAFGVWQAAAHLGMRSAMAGTPGTPVWYELVVRDSTAAGRFYPAVFGYETGKPALGREAGVDVNVDGHGTAGAVTSPGRRADGPTASAKGGNTNGATPSVTRGDTSGATRGAVGSRAPRAGSSPPPSPASGGAGAVSAGSDGGGGGEGGDAGASDSEAFDYLTLYLDGNPVAGVHGVGRTLSHERGPHWKTYFAVADTDASVHKVSALGGRLVTAPHDSPFGRVATVADREGAQFSVIASGLPG